MTTALPVIEQNLSAELLREAVSQDPLLSTDRLLQRLFGWWFNGLVYNQIWEDSRVDIQALALEPGQHVMTISSAGCNVLSYLAHCPVRITAVDLNASHLHVTRLKLAAAQTLPSAEAFQLFFVHAASEENVHNYYRYVRSALCPEAQRFWEDSPGVGIFSGPRIRYFAKGFYRYSRSSTFIRILHILCHFGGCQPRKILTAATLEEQVQLYERHLEPIFQHWVVRLLANSPVTLFSLGIPPQQHAAMKRALSGGFAKLFEARVRHLLCDFPISDNHFAWQAMARRYDVEGGRAIPDYLKRENFGVLQSRATLATTHMNSVVRAIQRAAPQSIDRIILLDSQDWMSAKTLATLWGAISDALCPGGRVIFRTAAEESPLEGSVPREVMRKFEYQPEESRRLCRLDRSAIYGGFHLYRLIT